MLRIAKSRGWSKQLNWILPVIAAVLWFGLYKVVYRPYLIYERHFTEITGMEFPKNAEFKYVEPWFAVGSEKRSSVSVIELDGDLLQTMIAQLPNAGLPEVPADFTKDRFLQPRVSDALQVIKGLTIEKEFVRSYGMDDLDQFKKQEKTENRKKMKDMGLEQGENPDVYSEGLTFKYVGILSDGKTIIAYIYKD